MEFLIDKINFLSDNAAGIGLIFVVIAGFWSFVKFKEHLKDKRFQTYHALIEQLVDEQRNPDKIIKLDRQIAIIYELRSYPSYYPVTHRILSGLKEEWSNSNKRIVREIELSLAFINKPHNFKLWQGKIEE